MCLTRKLTQAQVVLSAILAILTVSSISPSYARPDARVLAAAKTCEPKARALLQQLVQIDQPRLPNQRARVAASIAPI
jgi:hypothetical protein